MKTLMIDSGPVYDRIALFQDGRLDDLLLEPAQNRPLSDLSIKVG